MLKYSLPALVMGFVLDLLSEIPDGCIILSVSSEI